GRCAACSTARDPGTRAGERRRFVRLGCELGARSDPTGCADGDLRAFAAPPASTHPASTAPRLNEAERPAHRGRSSYVAEDLVKDPTRQRVLVVDDSPAIHELLAVRFKSEDIELLHAESAAEGLQLAAQSLPDLVLLD